MDELQKAFVLHRQSFRETSALVSFWVEDLGLIKAVVKGVRGHKNNALKNAWLQPLQLLQIQIRGRHDLKNVYKFEPLATGIVIKPQMLMPMAYINEILLFTLNKYETETALFGDYQNLLLNLSGLFNGDDFSSKCTEDRSDFNKAIAVYLRVFEQRILEATGFPFSWEFDIEDQPIQEMQLYNFEAGSGFKKNSEGLYSGNLILAIQHSQWLQAGALSVARRVLLQQLEWALGRVLHAPSRQGS